MRLKVNGIEIRVIDKIEVILEVGEEGDTILNGVDVHIAGGPLTANQGNSRAAFYLHHDSFLRFLANDSSGYLYVGPHTGCISHVDTTASERA